MPRSLSPWRGGPCDPMPSPASLSTSRSAERPARCASSAVAAVAGVAAFALGTAPLLAQPVQWVDKPLQRETTYPAVVYDQGRALAVLYGGAQRAGAVAHDSNETWEWDGTRWLY